MSDGHAPVLIVGGSVVGLSTAMFLAHHNVPCVLVERHPSTSIHPRAVGYYPRTIELLRSAGVADAVEKAASGFAAHRTRAGVESLAGKELFAKEELEDEDALSDLTPCRMVLLPQDRLEPHLRYRAEELGAELRFGTELRSFEQDADGVTAVLADVTTGETTTLRADYLVAADGPRSAVRESLGIARTGRGVLSRHVSIAFNADMSEALRGRRFSVVHVQNPVVSGILVHDDTLTEGTFIVAYDPDKGESLEDFSDDRCAELVRAAIGDQSTAIRIRSVFPWDMAEQVAERFVDGRVLLAGDAAHVIPPTGGYGANTGIADAHNLAWKLAMVLHGQAGPELVDTYAAEREPVGRYVAGQGSLTLAVRSKKATEEQLAAVDDAITVTTGYRYRSTAVRAEGDLDQVAIDPRALGGEPGGRAPHVLLELHGESVSTVDLFGKDFVLLSGDPADAWMRAAESVSAELEIPVVTQKVATTGWCTAYGVDAEGAVLVRPDGFVAWRSRGRSAQDPVRELTAVFRSVLSR